MGKPADEGTATGVLRVHLLGGFAVEGIEDRALGTRKARRVLKRLALAGCRPVPAEELVAAVWGMQRPSQPYDQLSVLVSRLRSVLGAGRLVRTEAGYALLADWVDVVELEARAGEIEERLRSGEVGSALAAGQDALAIIRGPLLPEEDADWVDEVRPVVDRLVARARLLAAEAALAAGQPAAAQAAAQSSLDHDPYDEAALRVVMRADAASGRPGAALAVYAIVRQRLAEDLGVDPAPETEQLHTAILRGEVPGPPTRLSEEVFVGRTGEEEQLDGLLRRAQLGKSVAVVIEAEAGMGKSLLLGAWTSRAARSALVLEGRCDQLGHDLPLQPLIDGLASYLQAVGRDAAGGLLGNEAVALAPLLGVSPERSPVEATPAVSRPATVTTVGDADAGRSALFASLAAVLMRAAASRPLVLAVDDLHQAAAGTAEFLAFALRRIPRLLVVATRRPEPGPDLGDVPRLRLGPLTLDDAVALIGAERGRALHERSGGHPLFLQALALAPDGDLPVSIVEAVSARLTRLGEAARSVEAAASCGTEVDVDLVAAVTARPVTNVLDELEAAARARLLVPRGAALAFSHELVRGAVEAATSPARRMAIHRAAVVSLASRSRYDALGLARHARLGGDPVVAGRALVAVDMARRGILEPNLGHPFAPMHGRFTLAYALALVGRWAEALDAVDDLDRLVVQRADRRFGPLAGNLRGWLLRGAGQLEQAAELHGQAAEAPTGPTFLEPHYAALLDLVEDALAAADLDRAAKAVARCAGVMDWTGSMSWRHRNRYRLLVARVASAGGEHDGAAEDAMEVAVVAAQRGDRRYELRGKLISATIRARAGCLPGPALLDAVVVPFVPVCGPDGWRDLAELASATGSDAVWHQAESQAAVLVGAAGGRAGVIGDRVVRAVRDQLDRYRP